MKPGGRTQQKARTREALTRAALRLLDEGLTPTVEQAAAAAAVSRATAYRYFPSQSQLLVASLPEMVEPSLLGEQPPEEPEARLDIVTAAITRQAVDYEPQLRAMLRLSLEPDAPQRDDRPFRVGRRIVWISEALAPLEPRLPRDEFQRLVLAISATVGIDALVWLTDIARLSRPDAVELMRWSARRLLTATLTDAAGTASAETG
jgi:AcrR family transcriptional regulator